MHCKKLMARQADVLQHIMDNHDDTSDVEQRISLALNESNNVVLCGFKESVATAAALRCAVKSSCKTVVYARYERDKFVNRSISVDTVLKHSLCCLGNNEHFDSVNEVEQLLCEDAVLIVDNYCIGAPSPYMRHLFGLCCKVIVVSNAVMENAGKNAVVVKSDEREISLHDFSMLDKEGTELLMTLCAILKYLDSSVKIVSSREGIFNRESVSFYLEALSEKLDNLIENGFVKETDKGRLYIDTQIINSVISVFSPNAQNCKTFMSFAERMCSFVIDQESKDVSAILKVNEKYNSFAASEEFLAAYTHFVKTDENRAKKLYNSMMALVLDKCAMQKGEDYMGYLCLKNKDYYLSCLKKCFEDKDFLDLLYIENDYLPCAYTGKIRAKLDLLRLVTAFIRNITADMYAENEELFRMLYDTMESIMDTLHDGSVDNASAMLIADDVIRLCEESFGYFEVIDDDGTYNAKREKTDSHRVFYRSEKKCDAVDACSILMGYSTDTLRLYGMYQKYLDVWLELSASYESRFSNPVLRQLYNEKLYERNHRRKAMSTHFLRIVNGLETYSEYLSEKNTDVRIYDYRFDLNTEKRLARNKHLFNRGFDGGTKTGAEKYSEMIINAVAGAENVFVTLLPVLCFDYPVNDAVYALLLKKELASTVRETALTDRTKQMLLENLVSNYRQDLSKPCLVKLYEQLIVMLWENTSHNESSQKRLYHEVCSLYVRQNILDATDNDTKNNNFSTLLYERIIFSCDIMPIYCDDLLSQTVYDMKHGKKVVIPKDKLFGALEVFVYENKLLDDTAAQNGAVKLAEKLLCREKAYIIKAMVKL